MQISTTIGKPNFSNLARYADFFLVHQAKFQLCN